MALYHNLSCTKSNLGRRAENSFLWALSYPNLFFLHILLSHPFKHLCKKRTKTLQLQVETPLCQLWERCQCHTGVGTAWPPALAPQHSDGSSHCRASTASRRSQQLHIADRLRGQPHWLRLLQRRNNCWLYSGQHFRGGVFFCRGKLWPVITQQYK